jgi:hypothetical protein
VRLVFADRTELTSHIYITDKRKHMARAELKACGFDVDAYDVDKLEAEPQFLLSNEVMVNVFTDEWNGQRKLKAEIDIPKSKPDAGTMKKATSFLREAKGKDADPDGAKKIIEGFPPQRPPKPTEDTEAPF